MMIVTRFASYPTLFERAYRKLENDFGRDFNVTNVIKL